MALWKDPFLKNIIHCLILICIQMSDLVETVVVFKFLLEFEGNFH